MTESLLSFPELEVGDAATLNAWFPSAQTLVDRCRGAGGEIAATPGALTEAIEAMAAPSWELSASPYTTRVSALAAAQGIDFVHHERRHALRRAEETRGEVRGVADFETETGWEDGVWIAPKYGAFTLEERLACRDPNLRPKWRPHELLHRLVGFFWHPEMTRFEAYVGARLGELLPVVHWYGFDEIFRGRCETHARVQRYRVHCPACEDAARDGAMFVGAPDAAAREAALWFASFGRSHLVEEVSAVDEELRTGRRVETFRPRLNASSDAVGYVRGHWNRMTSWGMGAWVEMFLDPSRDYSTTVHGLMDRVVSVSAAVVAGTCAADIDAGAWRRRRRVLQDLGMRTFIAIERAGESAEEAAMPVLARLGGRVRGATGPFSTSEEAENLQDIEGLFGLLERVSEGLGAQVFCAGIDCGIANDGATGTATRAWITSHAMEGVRSGLPDLAEDVDTKALEASVAAFVRAPAFDDGASLRARFCRWLRDGGHAWAEEASLEHLVRRRPHRDEEAELFGALPTIETLAGGELRMNVTARMGTFSPQAVTRVLGWSPTGDVGVTEVVAAWFDGSARAMAVTEELRRTIEAVREGDWENRADPSQIVELVSKGIMVWLPRVAAPEVP